MLNNPAARRAASMVIDPPARALIKLRVSPDVVTVIGTLGAVCGAALFFPRGDFIPGVIIIAVFAIADLLDGTMARMLGSSGPWGNFLDATLDRIADGAIFGSLVVWAVGTSNPWTITASVVALVAGQVTSYAKARAEAVGATANVGIAERAERLILVLAAAFITGCGVPWALPIALGVLAVFGTITVIQRIWVVRSQLRSRA